MNDISYLSEIRGCTFLQELLLISSISICHTKTTQKFFLNIQNVFLTFQLLVIYSLMTKIPSKSEGNVEDVGNQLSYT